MNTRPTPQNVSAELKALVIDLQASRFDEVIRGALPLLSRMSDSGLVWKLLGFAQLAKGYDAINSLSKAAEILPNDVDVLCNLSQAFLSRRRFDDAQIAAQRAIELNPRMAAAYCNLGMALFEIGDLLGAGEAFRKQIFVSPGDALGFANLGGVLLDLGRFDEADRCFRDALARDRSSAVAQLGLAERLLTAGSYLDGWALYEARWRIAGAPRGARGLGKHWDGQESIEGKRLMVFGEQGFGDSFQFLRYVSLLVKLGAVVYLGIRPELVLLYKDMPGVAAIVTEGETLPAFDLCVTIMSLPRIFRTTLDTIPLPDGYLSAPVVHAAKWKIMLTDGAQIRVGIVWAGNPTHKNDRNRSTQLKTLVPLLSVAGCKFYSLQKAPPGADIVLLSQLTEIANLGPQLQNFADTAGVIANLDVVITVDSSVAHLAGSMGKKVWVMLPAVPEWRWLCDRKDSPWYSSATLFRQKTVGDWTSVIDEMRAALCVEVDAK